MLGSAQPTNGTPQLAHGTKSDARGHVPAPHFPLRPRPTIELAPATEPAPPTELAPSIEQFAYRYGQVYDSHLAAEADRQRFRATDGSGMLSYVRLGRHLKIGGGLLAPAESRERLLREFLEQCRVRKQTAAFFTITEADVELFHRAGCEVAKWGEDPIVDLASWNCRGKDFEWLRRQRNFCRRQGVDCREWSPSEVGHEERAAVLAEIRAVSQEWLAAKPQAEPLGFFNGEPTPEILERGRVFLVRAEEGRGALEAFVVASPFDDGRRFALDIYRHRNDAVRGAIPFAMLHALDTLQAEGIEAVSLCMVAAMGTTPAGERATLADRLLSWGGRSLSPLFDLAGMYHYKSRFRPRFEPRYVCTWPRATLMTSLTNFYLTGITNFSVGKLCRRTWSLWRKRRLRTLATPD